MVYCFILLISVSIWILLTKNIGGAFFYLPIFIILVFFGGARGRYVGTDSGAYVNRLTEEADLEKIRNQFNEEDTDFARIKKVVLGEPGYTFLNYVTGKISNNYWAIFTTTGIFVTGFYLLSFSKLSVDAAISVFVLITMGWFFFYTNGARQGIAAAIYMCSITSLVKRDFTRYCLWILLAMTFHKSIVFAIPLYFIFIQPNNFRQNLLILLLGFLCVMFLQNIIGIAAEITDDYAGMAESENSGGKLYVLFYILLSSGFLFAKYFISEEDRPAYDTYLNMIMFGALIYVAVYGANLTQNLMRFAFYFVTAACFAWPLLLKNMRTRGLYTITLTVFLLGSLFYYYVNMSNNGMLTYTFNEWLHPYLGL